MGWTNRADENGNVEILVSRWYSQLPPKGKGKKEILLCAGGFDPHEPVQIEIMADEA